MIDIEQVLNQYGCYFASHGPNTRANNISVKCPFCADDPSQHLNISLSGTGWSCFRNKSHKGRSLRYLFEHLLKISESELDAILGKKQITAASDLLSQFKQLVNPKEKLVLLNDATKLWERDFSRLDDESAPCRAIRKYLRGRGYAATGLDDLIAGNDLRYTMTGDFALRVVFPLYGDSCLRGWTGRDITGTALARYRTQDHGWGKCLVSGMRRITNPRPIILVEGPFDALRINYVARRFGLPVRSLAMLGTSPADNQVGTLIRMIPKACPIWLLFDDAAEIEAEDMLRRLSLLRVQKARLPDGVKDPAELGFSEAGKFLESFS